MELTHGSLFSGIGGFDLGFERAGFTTLWQVEIDPYCQAILEKHFPNTPRYEDIKEVNKGNLVEVNVISGGFPCQDISIAGKGKGLTGERSGLWTEMFRVVSELRPRYVVVENVAALLFRGLGRILGDLSEIGYDAEWEVLSAEAFGACHKRERTFLVAYPCGVRCNGRENSNCECSLLRICDQHWDGQATADEQRRLFQSRSDEDISDPSHAAHNHWQRIQRSRTQTLPWFPELSWGKSLRGIEDLRGRPNLPESLIRTKDDGVSREVDALGNAVIPQIAEEIAWMIRRVEETHA